MIGADTAEFYPALEREEEGERIASTWSRTARRLHEEFAVSVAFVGGKRALGGMLELLVHCHYVVAADGASLGMPEVTLPVVPGMEGCHWPLRKAATADRPRVMHLLLSGRPVRAADAVGWLIDYAGPMNDALATAWKIARDGDHAVTQRKLEAGRLEIPADVSGLPAVSAPEAEAGRAAIMECIQHACAVPLAEALGVQARHSAAFMVSEACRAGVVGADYTKTVRV
jgi:3-hydroxyacyl-CoA dehydrogenase